MIRMRLLGIGVGLLLNAPTVLAVTVDAGDYTRLPDGTGLGLVYLQTFAGSEQYVDGSDTNIDADLTAEVGILRGARFYEVGKLTIAPQFLLPFGQIDTGGDIASLESANGMGDLILAPTIHLLQDPRRSFAFTPWLYLPTGAYDADKAINALGENRWKLALQVAYVTPVSEHWMLDLIADAQFFGENDDFSPAGLTLDQDPLYELQSHLRYLVSAKTSLAALISYSWGGATEVDGIDQDNRQQRTKGLVTASYFVQPTLQILGSVGKDFSVEEGIAEDYRLNFRLLKVF